MFYKILEKISDSTYNYLCSTNVKSWYHSVYPSDNIYTDINPSSTLYDVVDRLYCKSDVYAYLADDSVVRERVFEHLSEVLNCEYDVIYYQWLSK